MGGADFGVLGFWGAGSSLVVCLSLPPNAVVLCASQDGLPPTSHLVPSLQCLPQCSCSLMNLWEYVGLHTHSVVLRC